MKNTADRKIPETLTDVHIDIASRRKINFISSILIEENALLDEGDGAAGFCSLLLLVAYFRLLLSLAYSAENQKIIYLLFFFLYLSPPTVFFLRPASSRHTDTRTAAGV